MQTASFYHMLSAIYLLIITRTTVSIQINFYLDTTSNSVATFQEDHKIKYLKSRYQQIVTSALSFY